MPALETIAHGPLLIKFADAFMQDAAGRDPDATVEAGADLTTLRREIAAGLSSAAVVDAAAVVSIFEAVVRIADATGITLEPAKAQKSEDFRATLGINDFRESAS